MVFLLGGKMIFGDLMNSKPKNLLILLIYILKNHLLLQRMMPKTKII